MDCYSKSEHQPGVCEVLYWMGLVYFKKGQIDKAKTFWEKGLYRAYRSNETELIGKLNERLGTLNCNEGNFKKAMSFFIRSKSSFERIGDIKRLAKVYYSIGCTFANMKQFSESNSYYERCFDLAKYIDDINLQALVNISKAQNYNVINDDRAAFALISHSLETIPMLNTHLNEYENTFLKKLFFND